MENRKWEWVDVLNECLKSDSPGTRRLLQCSQNREEDGGNVQSDLVQSIDTRDIYRVA